MSSLTANEIKKIAHLARLDLTEQDQDLYQSKLTSILSFIEEMSTVSDTNNILPQSHPLDLDQPLRKDEIIESNCREKYQQIAPQTEAGLYLVPKVIE